MGRGAITPYIDVAQLALYAFWVFFAGLIYYLQRETKREGFPLEGDRPDETMVTPGLIGTPGPKEFLSPHGLPSTVAGPGIKPSQQVLHARPAHRWIGAPLVPTGNPMQDGVGPGAYADRLDVPDMTVDGLIKIVPLRRAVQHGISPRDIDPRGLPVLGDDGVVGGVVSDVWVDRSEVLIRYLEVAVADAAGGPQVLLPMNFSRVCRDCIKVKSILGRQFAGVPRLNNPDQVTFLEEEKVMAYYGGGTLYAEPSRQEPLV